MEILVIGVILLYVLQVNKKVDTGKFIRDNGNWLRKFKESDYDFLVRSKYGEDADPDLLFDKRIQNAFIVVVVLLFLSIIYKYFSRICRWICHI